MSSIKADVGIFHRGDKQIGGCYHATVRMKMGTIGKQGNYAEQKVMSTTADTRQWWFWEDEKDFQVAFYRVRKDGTMSRICQHNIENFAQFPHQKGEVMKTSITLKFQ